MALVRFKTSRGKDTFCLDGYSYRQDKRPSDGEQLFLRCINQNCSVRMESRGLEDVPQPRGQAQHTHGPRVEEGLHRRAVTSMKELVTFDSRPIPEAYANVGIVLNTQYPVAASILPTQTSLKSALLRARRSICPPIPVAIDNIHNIPDVFSNIGEDGFLLSKYLKRRTGWPASVLYQRWFALAP